MGEKVRTKKKSKVTHRGVAIELSKVSKVYSFRQEKPTFTELLFSFGERKQFKALDDVNLTIYKGEKVGIIGHNGSGKTTILKIISKISTPTMGSVFTNGKVVSLIDLTAGFHPELTGYENIFLNGLIIGMSKDDINDNLEKIIDFADIKEFIYSPIYTYSDGMKLRLGFSIAIYSNPDVLILDEGITAGDIDFQKKSGEKIEQLFREDKTIIVVSHWLDYLKRHCNKFLVMENGKIVKSGGKEIIRSYKK